MNADQRNRRVKRWVAVLLLAVLPTPPLYWIATSLDDDDPAFIDAARTGDMKAATRFIERGADLTAVDRIYGSTPVMWAAHEGHTEVLALLLKYGGDPDTRNPLGRTALWFAAQQGQKHTARLLIEHGVANVNPISDQGMAASQVALQNGHHELAGFLRQTRGM